MVALAVVEPRVSRWWANELVAHAFADVTEEAQELVVRLVSVEEFVALEAVLDHERGEAVSQRDEHGRLLDLRSLRSDRRTNEGREALLGRWRSVQRFSEEARLCRFEDCELGPVLLRERLRNDTGFFEENGDMIQNGLQGVLHLGCDSPGGSPFTLARGDKKGNFANLRPIS